MLENIHPEFHRQLDRPAKESLLQQRGRVIWLYGLSGSGKSTLAHAVERSLHLQGRATTLLDGDNLRTGLNSGLTFSEDDRRENIRRVAEVAKLFAQSGVITLCSFICPYRTLRSLARQIVGQEDFIEVYVHASFESCAKRDPKGLYQKAAEGKVAHFTGRDSVFELPEAPSPDLFIDTEKYDQAQCLEQIMERIRPWVALGDAV